MGLANRRSVQTPHYWGLVQQVGPWAPTPIDLARMNTFQRVNRGGGVPDGGTAHAGHGVWNTLITPKVEAFPSKAPPEPSPYSKISKVIPGPPQEPSRPGRPSKYVYNYAASGKNFQRETVTHTVDTTEYQELTHPLHDVHVASPTIERSIQVGPFAHEIDDEEESLYEEARSNASAEIELDVPHEPLLTSSQENIVHLAPEYAPTPFNISTQTDEGYTPLETFLLKEQVKAFDEIDMLMKNTDLLKQSYQKNTGNLQLALNNILANFGISNETLVSIDQTILSAQQGRLEFEEAQEAIYQLIQDDFVQKYQFRAPLKTVNESGTQTQAKANTEGVRYTPMAVDTNYNNIDYTTASTLGKRGRRPPTGPPPKYRVKNQALRINTQVPKSKVNRAQNAPAHGVFDQPTRETRQTDDQKYLAQRAKHAQREINQARKKYLK